MSDLKALKDNLLKRVLNYLVDHGFEKKIYGQSFRKKIDGGRQNIHLGIIKHDNDFDITVSAGIRFDMLEDLKNEDNKLLNEKEKKETSTFGVELGNITEGAQNRWTVVEESDIEPVVKGIYKYILHSGFPFLEKYNNMENAFELVKRDDPDVWIFDALHNRRAMNAVGLAYLLKRYDVIGSIIETKTKFLKERNDFGLQTFLQFADKIKTMI
jgi:hypothetical protein